jgi:hypothetical protein
MSWLRIDDGFAEHPKLVNLSDAAFRTHVSALCYASRNLTDGHVPAAVAKQFTRNRRKPINDLVDAGVWARNGSHGFVIHDYLVYNEPRDDVLKRRAEVSKIRSEAGKKGMASRWPNR